VAFVLTQDRGGPVDLTVGLARELAGRPGVDVAVVGPTPVSSAGDVGDLLHPAAVPSKADVAAMAAVGRTLRGLRPDVVHAQDRRALLAVTAGRPGAPVVGTFHGLPDAAAGAWLTAGPLAGRPVPGRAAAALAADAALCRLAAATVVPSASLAGFLRRRLHLPARRLHVIPNGVARRAPVEPRPVRRIVAVGSFAPPKAVPVLVRAFAGVAGRHPDLTLTLVGDGDERALCEAMAAGLGVAGRVTFTGYRTDVAALLAGADAFALPSVNENLPLALLEAMATGLPCVASAVGGVPEALGGAGLLVRPGDHRDLAAALDRLAGDPGLAALLGRAAAARSARYTVDRCASAHLALYERVAAA
jgi:glycosyltransferase involved in cell wall biosynthesis